MKNHEEKARDYKKQGNNCSKSINMAFIEDCEISNDYPAPRSIDGKCGALLSSLKILRETGHEDKIEEFEKEFIRRFGFSTCIDLMRKDRRCNDYVGECARMLDEILNG